MDLVQSGYYDKRVLKKSDTALMVDTLAGSTAASAGTSGAASGEGAEGDGDGGGGGGGRGGDSNGDGSGDSSRGAAYSGAVGAREALPLEVKPLDQFEPRYRSPLNVMGGEEMPTLPLSVNGALAMARGRGGDISYYDAPVSSA